MVDNKRNCLRHDIAQVPRNASFHCVTPRSMAADVRNCGRFISTATTATAPSLFRIERQRTRGAHETGRVKRDFEEATAGPWMFQTSEWRARLLSSDATSVASCDLQTAE